MTTLDLAPLVSRAATLVVGRDGEECVIGRAELGRYLAVPEPGAVFVEALRSGASLAAATAAASEAAGEEVDGEDFILTLAEEGLLDDVDPATSTGRQRAIRWIEGVRPETAARLFGRVAWAGYLAAALFSVGVLVGRPELRPTFEAAWFLADPVLSLLWSGVVLMVLDALHEMWHWLAARAIGVPAVFRVSYRSLFLVFETDVSQIATVPRRRRYGVFLAGMAFEGVVLAVALALRLLYRADLAGVPPWLDRVAAMVVLGVCFSLAWQCGAVFLRSDMYAVLANALRCHNLYRATWLTVKDRLVGLRAGEADEFAAVDPYERRVAGRFAVGYLVGMLGVTWMFLQLTAPALLAMAVWLVHNLAEGDVGSATFWECVAAVGYLVALYGLPPLLALRERRLRREGRLA
ncbi:hypothetical protein [Micromonospora auratinigra]|uniref:Peptide zinc metalloprotease protein n=1 Tax=Micromonospora auratinigra TaxID=261654 RepID=A0A1A9A3K1_9ACTN|nr:hypothetical protein [Micromonospora auratinigra]SBT51029.1 hypothetical protein GA0070611_4991 [Micromonospora auratinigra]